MLYLLLPWDYQRAIVLYFAQIPQLLILGGLLSDLSLTHHDLSGLWISFLRLDQVRGSGLFMLFLCPLILSDNSFFLLLLLGLLLGLDLALLLPENPLYLFRKAKGF